jgi:hypothetical protein
MPRCANGTRKNKRTGVCESKSRGTTQKRCSRGTRRNKKTGNCEKNEMLSNTGHKSPTIMNIPQKDINTRGRIYASRPANSFQYYIPSGRFYRQVYLYLPDNTPFVLRELATHIGISLRSKMDTHKLVDEITRHIVFGDLGKLIIDWDNETYTFESSGIP